jgi:hypothetical protein
LLAAGELYWRRSKTRLISGTSAARSAFLISDATTKGATPTSQALSTQSFMPNARQANPAVDLGDLATLSPLPG